MRPIWKASSILAALALLVVVMGLSTSNVVQAQAPGTITIPNKYLCSLEACGTGTAPTNTSGTIEVREAGGITEVEVLNLDVAKVSVPDPDTPGATISLNPRTITFPGAITVVQEFTDTTPADGVPDVATEIRAFNGNRVQVTFKPTSGFATTATILVDNVKPTLVTNSPTIPLVTRKGVNVTFSADITDGGSGYTANVGAGNDNDIEDLNETPGTLTTANATTPRGGVRLVVAGNVVSLAKGDFTKIDGGWRVSKSLGSDAIQNIGANVPWYFETRDRAGNTRRSSGNIPLKGTVTPGITAVGGIIDARFAGGLPGTSFTGTKMKVTRGSASETVDIAAFLPGTGAFTITIPDLGFFAAATESSTAVLAGDKFELVGSNLLSIDGLAPDSARAVTGIVYSTSKKMAVRGLSGKANSIRVTFDDDGKTAGDDAGSGLDPASVTPSAFSVGGNTVNSVSTQGNDVYLTLAENLASDAQPTIVIANGVIKDKAGNAASGTRIAKAADGLGPNLGLSEDKDLSKEKVTVTISTDEQLANLPEVKLSRVIDNDGGVVTDGDRECVYAAVDAETTPTPLPALPKLNRALETDGTCLAPDADSTDDLNDRYTATTPSDVVGQPADSPDPSQTAALSYSYAVTATTANPAGENVVGGKYNVYVEGVDTQDPLNKGKVGHASDANNAAAFTFQLDTKLNSGGDPKVSVADETATASSGEAPEVEAVDPMIVTVDWEDEAGEYPGDSYKTVELTSASLKITFADGSSESKTFDLTTEVSSADKIKYTIPLLNPKVGLYTLTVKGTDSAGNASGTTGHSASWKVVAAKPVNINLEPGWNLISLPFQPANPAINSVIGANHPVDIVMTYDNASQIWMVSRRDAESGLFVGDITVMTANTAYFVRTDKFEAIKLLRPALATAAAAPPPPPAIAVVEGWNLVPVVSNEIPTPPSIDADDYFGTLGDKGWLKALTFNTLLRTWDSVSPGEKDDDENPVKVTVGKGYWLYATADGVIIP